MSCIKGLCFLCFITMGSFCFAASLPPGFVYLHHIDSSISQDLGFATNDNFVGTPLDHYKGDQVICTKSAATAIKKAQKSLKKAYPHYSLEVKDAYRPASAVEHIKRWAHDLEDQETKEKYYPDMDKKDLLGGFIAAKRSSHSRGSTFDVVIIDTRTQEELDFGPDFFGDYANYDYAHLTPEQKKNRKILRQLMMKHGFKPYDKEFWHFTLKNEPFPETYFDFAIYNAKG